MTVKAHFKVALKIHLTTHSLCPVYELLVLKNDSQYYYPLYIMELV
jgi:hypothetical protein